MKKDLVRPKQQGEGNFSSSLSSPKPLPTRNEETCGRVVTPRVTTGKRLTIQRLRKIAQAKKNDENAQVLLEETLLEADKAAEEYHYESDSDGSCRSMPPLMELAELSSDGRNPDSFYSNYDTGRDNSWRYTVPDSYDESPPSRPPSPTTSTLQPPYQPAP